MDTRAAAATGVRVPLSLHPPGNRRGFVAPADCVLPHVNSLSTDVVSPLRGTSRRVYSSELGL